MMERVCEERCRPRPPVRTSRAKEVEASGVWRLRRRALMWLRAGRSDIKSKGRMATKAKIWWGVLKALDWWWVSMLVYYDVSNNHIGERLTRLYCPLTTPPRTKLTIRKTRMIALNITWILMFLNTATAIRFNGQRMKSARQPMMA